MIRLRPSAARGQADHGWLLARHTFSFADYVDPEHMGFGSLRVINEDRVQPGRGFQTHGHRDMEILTYVLDGVLEHKDNTGNGTAIRPGELQRMSAGTGILHSEMNGSDREIVHLLQIWITPEREGLAPGYEQRAFDVHTPGARLTLVAARDGRDGALTVHQDVEVHAGTLAAGTRYQHALATGRCGWIQIARGNGVVAGHRVAAGDGVAIADEASVTIEAEADTELLLFDMA